MLIACFGQSVQIAEIPDENRSKNQQNLVTKLQNIILFMQSIKYSAADML